MQTNLQTFLRVNAFYADWNPLYGRAKTGCCGFAVAALGWDMAFTEEQLAPVWDDQSRSDHNGTPLFPTWGDEHVLIAKYRQMGQLFMMGFDGMTVTPEIRSLIEDYHIGSIMLTAKNLKCCTRPKLPS